jgi:hypothetical protein
MIYKQNTQIVYASGASAMNGTLHATALVNTGYVESVLRDNRIYCVRVTCAAAHGIVVESQLRFSDLDNDTALNYRSNQMRMVIVAPAATTMDVACPEGFTAGTPTTSELYAAGFVSDDNWQFLGFKLHLSAAEAAGETLTLTAGSKRGTAWDTLVYSKLMTDVTDIIYFPHEDLPMSGGESLKFAWANTGAKTWGLEMFVVPRV